MIFRQSKKIKNRFIDPDQILMDAENRPKFNTQQFEGMIERPISKRSIRWFGFFVILFMLIFVAQLVKVQIVGGKKFFALSENNRLHEIPIFSERGIYMWEFRLFGKGRELFVAEWTPSIDANGTLIPPEKRKLEKHAFDGLPRPGDRSSDALMWMDNKGLMREKFSAAGIPIAQGGVAFLWWKTKKLFQKLTPPVIIKPNLGSRSRHTTTHIVNLEQLQAAYKNATVLSPWVIIEEEHIGLVHRATVIGGKLIGVLRREPPCVWGDGIHTIAELIAIENENPLRKGPIFHEINIESPELHKELRRQTLTLDHVAGPNILVTLGEKASRGLGGGATDVTDETHPDNRELFEYVAQVLEDPLVGIDFIIDDISKSWKEQRRCGVIECNSLPFIELHLFPLKGLPRDTAGALWDTIFPDSNPHLQK
jgi:D-alanine-D-alanine ligase-like ATP-grasp enzyme